MIVPVLYKERNFNISPPSIQPGGIKNEFLLQLDQNAELAKQNQNARNKQVMDTYASMMEEKRKHNREIADTIRQSLNEKGSEIKGLTAQSSKLKAMWTNEVNKAYASIASGASAVAATSNFSSSLSPAMAQAIAEEQVVAKTIEIFDEINKDEKSNGFFDTGSYIADVLEGKVSPMDLDSTKHRERYWQADYEKISYQVNKDCIEGVISGKFSVKTDDLVMGDRYSIITTDDYKKKLHDRCRQQYINQVKVSVSREFDNLYTAQGYEVGDEKYDDNKKAYIEKHTNLWFGNPDDLDIRNEDIAITKDVKGIGRSGSGSGPKPPEQIIRSTFYSDKEVEGGFYDAYRTTNQLGEQDQNGKGFNINSDFDITSDMLHHVFDTNPKTDEEYSENLDYANNLNQWVMKNAPKEHFDVNSLITDGAHMYNALLVATNTVKNEKKDKSKGLSVTFPITDPKIADRVRELYEVVSANAGEKSEDILKALEKAGFKDLPNNASLGIIAKNSNAFVTSLGLVANNGKFDNVKNPFLAICGSGKQQDNVAVFTDKGDSIYNANVKQLLGKLGMFISIPRRDVPIRDTVPTGDNDYITTFAQNNTGMSFLRNVESYPWFYTDISREYNKEIISAHQRGVARYQDNDNKNVCKDLEQSTEVNKDNNPSAGPQSNKQAEF